MSRREFDRSRSELKREGETRDVGIDRRARRSSWKLAFQTLKNAEEPQEGRRRRRRKQRTTDITQDTVISGWKNVMKQVNRQRAAHRVAISDVKEISENSKRKRTIDECRDIVVFSLRDVIKSESYVSVGIEISAETIAKRSQMDRVCNDPFERRN